ncbi:hypothetical protein AMS68_004914 [Peltaster fructicola]|uniref:MARVEL domain-containing protein n=1 Tax=Peltaster fructicola TaxID=286661 RepID=A0A6H0XX95_9PEZI|nr:hypothetical protein AMS68_004914 [Peltaster fructicola]
MRKPLDKLGKIKAGLHVVQALFIFIAWALTIAVLTRDGGIGGSTWFYFTLCFITAPALIYQVMVPMYPRAERFASVYAYATIDTLFAVLWFSAAIAVAAWNTAGLNKGKDDNKDSDGSCNYFGYGDTTKCSVSKAAVGFGILIFFLFASTATISVLFCRQYRQTGVVPGTKQASSSTIGRADDTSKDVWSSNVEEREYDDFEEPDDRHKYGQVSDEDGQGLLQEPTALLQGASSLNQGQNYDIYAPSSLSSGSHHHDASTAYRSPLMVPDQHHDGRAQFPVARYDRI